MSPWVLGSLGPWFHVYVTVTEPIDMPVERYQSSDNALNKRNGISTYVALLLLLLLLLLLIRARWRGGGAGRGDHLYDNYIPISTHAHTHVDRSMVWGTNVSLGSRDKRRSSVTESTKVTTWWGTALLPDTIRWQEPCPYGFGAAYDWSAVHCNKPLTTRKRMLDINGNCVSTISKLLQHGT